MRGPVYVEAPTDWPGDVEQRPAIFLAGGITACADWQADVRAMLADVPVVLLSPRRADFDVTRGDSAEQQVAWEYRHLRRADVTMFWFPACDPRRTVQPIALFELGSAIGAGRNFVVGADPGYPRRADVAMQLANAGGPAPTDTLEATVVAALAAVTISP